jgi:radical SAM protein
VYWEVTRGCDLVCRHCRAEAAPEPDPAQLSTHEGLALIARLAAFEVPLPHLVLTGGDPIARRDLFELIAAARARGFEVSVAPSATPRLTAETIAALAAAGVAAISLSLDGADAARHDGLRGVPGCFGRTVAAARAAVSNGLPFQVNTLVSDETLDDLGAIYLLAGALGAQRWSLFFLVSVGRGTLLQPITPEACERLFQRLLDLSRAGGPLITTTEAPHFRRVVLERARRAGRGQTALPRGPLGHAAGIRDGNGIMFISHTGDVWPSGFLPVSAGSVRTTDPVEIYRDAELFRSLRRVELLGGRCGRCEWREACGGSRARAFAASGDPLGEDPLCSYEPIASAR